MKLIVLMSTYNGEKYIREQLDSLLRQTVKPYKILIRDDGSKDDTMRILEEYASEYPIISYYSGKNMGPAKSFWNLIVNCENADYYALCDQDDVWFEDKLETAVNMLEKEGKDIPLLYCSKYTLTDKDLNPIDSNVSRLYGFSDFAHSLLYHTAPGCTFVFNDAARKKIAKYDVEKEYCIIHDAIIHKVVAMFGKVILDRDSHMYYRQHGNNQIGMDANVFKVFIGRVSRFINGKIRNYRSNTAKSLLHVYGAEVDSDKRELLRIVANYMDDPKLKKELLRKKCFKTGTVNDFFFEILVLVNYI
ncbi:MAG: glycosyltransferase family 2 protein [Erysipelotrichaceae bacterium]|nr:glycosyltransferase family 2 protein [Erysipelotrichaceae bacterium]